MPVVESQIVSAGQVTQVEEDESKYSVEEHDVREPSTAADCPKGVLLQYMSPAVE
jgi:hypothetical protein